MSTDNIAIMKESVIRILKNHNQSSIEGLHQITGGDKQTLQISVNSLLDDKLITQSKAMWNGTEWIVYKLKKNNLL